ncbi:MAG TPA: class I SAM-dependent methyltransferase [Chthonomonadaceae bacterium]|nr:class I SAM-dependent methyltransferase [Chthonomonadaceae bacterium]
MESAEALKSCCASLYEKDWVRLLLGDSYHPGGLALTERLGQLLELRPGMRVLDVAAGRGASALHLARTFGCAVIGTDLSAEMVRLAAESAAEAGLNALITFQQGDAERLPFEEEAFDVVLCECAFCTFPDKPTAAREFARVLRPGGNVGISDLTRESDLPAELETLLAWVACIADARPLEEYADHLRNAGCDRIQTELHPEALAQMVKEIRGRLVTAQLLVSLKKMELPGVDLAQAQAVARAAEQAIRDRKLGYALIVGHRHTG